MYLLKYLCTYAHKYVSMYIYIGKGELKIFQKGGRPKKGGIIWKVGGGGVKYPQWTMVLQQINQVIMIMGVYIGDNKLVITTGPCWY